MEHESVFSLLEEKATDWYAKLAYTCDWSWKSQFVYSALITGLSLFC